MQIFRLLKHILSGPWRVHLAFPIPSLKAIEEAITASETSHLGEIRFVVEAALDFGDLLQGITPRQRAIDVFSQCRVWDTEHNTGVLIYLLLADRDVEIVADRGIHDRVGDAVWAQICRHMEAQFRVGQFKSGVIDGIAQITVQLQQHFPASASENPNEISNAPLLL
jgi:uncharacterized membrane protein